MAEPNFRTLCIIFSSCFCGFSSYPYIINLLPPILLVHVLFSKFRLYFELWKMPRWTENAASTKSAELVKQQDRLEFDDPDEIDEEKEVEYEEQEVEEDVEYKEP
jgi:hypothetical protein